MDQFYHRHHKSKDLLEKVRSNVAFMGDTHQMCITSIKRTDQEFTIQQQKRPQSNAPFLSIRFSTHSVHFSSHWHTFCVWIYYCIFLFHSISERFWQWLMIKWFTCVISSMVTMRTNTQIHICDMLQTTKFDVICNDLCACACVCLCGLYAKHTINLAQLLNT